MNRAGQNVFEIKAGSTLPSIYEQLFGGNGRPIDLTTASAVRLHVLYADGTVADVAGAVWLGFDPETGDPITAVDGWVVHDWVHPETDKVDEKALREWQVFFASGDDEYVPSDRTGYPTRFFAHIA